ADGEHRLDRMARQELRERRLRGRGRLDEHPRRRPVVEREPPAVGVRPGPAAAHAQAGEREDDVRRDVAFHSEELAHRLLLARGLHARASAAAATKARNNRWRRAPARSLVEQGPSSEYNAALMRAWLRANRLPLACAALA